MSDRSGEVLNLLRISDTFFPLGSFTVSQGMEQLVAEHNWSKGELVPILRAYLDKIWKSFDLQMFSLALEAALTDDLERIMELDDLCYASKLSMENRVAMMKMGTNLAEAIAFPENTLGSVFKQRIHDEQAHGMYPVVLALVSRTLSLNEQGGLSLIYVNLMEVIASLVRMAEIDYLEAQQVMSQIIRDIVLRPTGIADLHQSYPLVDIASMRHELSQYRMFIS